MLSSVGVKAWSGKEDTTLLSMAAMWEVRIHHKRVFCYIESSVARTETSDGALESQW